jgi:hypothetical protein
MHPIPDPNTRAYSVQIDERAESEGLGLDTMSFAPITALELRAKVDTDAVDATPSKDQLASIRCAPTRTSNFVLDPLQ